jgi:6-phosphogluconolactonase
MIKGLKIFDTPEVLARYLADEIQSSINNSAGNYFLAISGGSTPLVLFNELAHPLFRDNIKWDKAHFFWCDERCVAPDDSESNFCAADRALFKQVPVPAINIHRIHGEDNPNEEVVRYSNEIEKFVPAGNGSLPQFDRVLLGLGEDGHTASLFPDKNLLFIYSNIAGVAKHPVTGQKRISLTADILCIAKRITFVVTQKEKAKVLSEILNSLPGSKNYPASQIKSAVENIDWFIDKEAAFYL